MSIITFPNNLREKIDKEGDEFPHLEFTITNEEGDFHKIHMFIPLAVSTADGITYSSVNLGVAGAVAQSTAARAIGGTGQKEATTSDIVALATKEAKANSQTLGTAAVISEISTGNIVNPYTTQNFDGVTVRSFAFNFKLIPTSAEEAKDIHRIENQFRKYMYPKDRGAGSLQYPPTFRIRFMIGDRENKYMPRIIQCYLTNMTATVNSTGNAFHKNDDLGASPTELDLALTFQEVRAITRDDLYDEAGIQYKNDRTNDGHVVGSQPDNAQAVTGG